MTGSGERRKHLSQQACLEVGYFIRKIHQRTTTSSFRAYRMPLNNVDIVKNFSSFCPLTNLTSYLRPSMLLSASSRVPLRYIRPVHPKLTKQKQTKTQCFGHIKKICSIYETFPQLVLFSATLPSPQNSALLGYYAENSGNFLPSPVAGR